MEGTVRPERPGAGRRSGRRLLVVVLAAALLAALAVGFPALARSPFDDVVVSLDVDPLACSGTALAPLIDEDRPTMPGLEVRPGMRCLYEFHVENRSGAAVRMTEVFLPISGPGAGAGVRAVAVYPVRDGGALIDVGQDSQAYLDNLVDVAGVEDMASASPVLAADRSEPGAVEARFVIDRSIEAGERIRFRVRLQHQDGCLADGWTIVEPVYPALELERWGVSGRPAATWAPLALAGTDETSCDT